MNDERSGCLLFPGIPILLLLGALGIGAIFGGGDANRTAVIVVFGLAFLGLIVLLVKSRDSGKNK